MGVRQKQMALAEIAPHIVANFDVALRVTVPQLALGPRQQSGQIRHLRRRLLLIGGQRLCAAQAAGRHFQRHPVAIGVTPPDISRLGHIARVAGDGERPHAGHHKAGVGDRGARGRTMLAQVAAQGQAVALHLRRHAPGGQIELAVVLLQIQAAALHLLGGGAVGLFAGRRVVQHAKKAFVAMGGGQQTGQKRDLAVAIHHHQFGVGRRIAVKQHGCSVLQKMPDAACRPLAAAAQQRQWQDRFEESSCMSAH